MDAEDELQYGLAVVDDETPTPIGDHDDQDWWRRIALDLLKDDQLALYKAEHRFSTVDPLICYTSGKSQISTNFFNRHSNA